MKPGYSAKFWAKTIRGAVVIVPDAVAEQMASIGDTFRVLRGDGSTSSAQLINNGSFWDATATVKLIGGA